jgi:hypothetical protein
MHRTPTSNDDPTVVHEITERFSSTAAADEAATTVDPTPAGVPDAGDASESSAPFAGSSAGSDAAGSGRPRTAKGRFATRWYGRQLDLDRREIDLIELEFAAERAAIDYEFERLKGEHRRKLETARTVAHAVAFGLESDRAAITAGVYAGMLDRAGKLVRRLPGGDGP